METTHLITRAILERYCESSLLDEKVNDFEITIQSTLYTFVYINYMEVDLYINNRHGNPLNWVHTFTSSDKLELFFKSLTNENI